MAEKRLISTTGKYLSCPDKFKVYDTIFEDWLAEGIIELVKEDHVLCQDVHYLPHRPVFKPQSVSTPVRPVFDASCKAKRSPSLNDCLDKGPNLMELIPSVLLRFREDKIGVVSDIRKAFQMVSVNENDQDYLRFLWWESDRKTFKVFKHARVVFGLNSSPFLLAAVIEHHLKSEETQDNKWILEKLKNGFYVDNCVTSMGTVEDYELFKKESINIMERAKMELRQWERSSVEDPGVGPESRKGRGLGSDRIALPEELSNVLGLIWDKGNDFLGYEIPSGDTGEVMTKRKILSIMQSIFDPIGILCPVLLQPKFILQKTWGLKLGWDDALPDEIQTVFIEWVKGLKFLMKIRFPRNMTGGNTSRETWQIHVFGDASQDAYSACIYLRTGNEGEVSVQLLQAKSRVTPIQKGKRPTIPRLELLACTISTRLCKAVKEALSISDEVPTFFWSDSTTALSWIKRNDEWGTFVGNRVREILRLSSVKDWRHIPGVHNPADLPSRGCSPEELFQSEWWKGPSWMKSCPRQWPVGEAVIDEVAIDQEKRNNTIGLVAVKSTCPLFKNLPFSSYRRNVRTLAFVLRFIRMSRNKLIGKLKGPITFEEYDAAEISMLKAIQEECFSSDDLISGLRVERREDGLLHVKTKLLYRQDTEGFRYPILLPKSHPLIDQLIRAEHYNHCHAGIQFVMSNLRERFWIINSRRVIRGVLAKCVTCRRYTAKAPVTVPTALPEDRVKSGKTFEITGVDLAGPLFVKVGRGKSQQKVWVVLFTCAVYRCVHLELVESLSTDDFLDALSNFVSRRGRPSVIYSDNGTNFVGAANAFQNINWNEIVEDCAARRINWTFNPPSSPWWGGWWERLVQSVKGLLRRMLGNAKLTHLKLHNVLIKIEGVINGRPLTTVNEDLDDLVPLTPAMFLHDIPCTAIEDLDACGFQRVNLERKNLLEEFKMRFRKEYLGLLVQRGKGRQVDFKLGDVVLVGSDHQKRWEWPMAKITELIKGKDGIVRVVKLKTANGYLTRPVQRIYNLEVDSPTDLNRLNLESSVMKRNLI